MDKKSKIAGLILTLGFLGTLGSCNVFSPGPRRACDRMAELCGMNEAQTTECGKQLDGLSGTLGKERIDKMLSCMKESKTCAEAGGCMAGAGAGAAAEQFNNFLQGFTRSLTK